jgi:hypothetical protein
MKTIKELRTAIESRPARSAWNKGVKVYALELIEEMGDTAEFSEARSDKKDLLTVRMIGINIHGAAVPSFMIQT